jgi:hypothetical protein
LAEALGFGSPDAALVSDGNDASAAIHAVNAVNAGTKTFGAGGL